jgi:3-dehydro-L-gulonate 2-dehydrogenase
MIMLISFAEMKQEFQRVLLKLGLSAERAETCARLFAETSLDGVYSHGLNRFPRFVDYIQKGFIKVAAEPEQVAAFGALERWDGRLGPGNLNAIQMMDRAMTVARENGIGCVALRNSNHWMRGGSYGWQAANKGFIAICWTNTTANVPPWGAAASFVGNNPFILAVPRPAGHIVLDMALSQYSYGKLESYQRDGKELPFEGGYDTNGRLTKDPAAIMASRRALPIGFWKGSGLSMLLDLIALLLAGGRTTAEIGRLEAEYGLSQVFVAVDPSRLPEASALQERIELYLEELRQLEPAEPDGRAYYPGERTLQTRNDNLTRGIPVDPGIWAKVRQM